jgi:polar amino acid transport system substrate-binding protein
MMIDVISRVVLALVLMCFGGLAQASSSPTLDRVLQLGVLKVGMSGDQPPLTMVSRQGDLIGLDVDMATAMAGALEVELELVQLPFGQLLEALQAGKLDMVISGMGITAERARSISFVGPYMMSGKSLLTRSDELANIYEAEQLNRGELRLAALRNSTSQSYIEAMAPAAEMILVED